MRAINVSVSYEVIQELRDTAHNLAHEEGGCDTRPLLLATLAYVELERVGGQVLDTLSADEITSTMSDITSTLSFSIANYMEGFLERIKDRLPKDLQERIAQATPTRH